MSTSNIIPLLALSVVGALLGLWAGLFLVVAFVALTCRRSSPITQANSEDWCPPRPTITYLVEARPDEPRLRLERGQTLTVLWPHSLHVLLPDGVGLHILEATSQRIRVMAV